MCHSEIALAICEHRGRAVCALCGEQTERLPGPEPFELATWRPVCRECANEHAPELTALLDGVRFWGRVEHRMMT